MCQADGWKSELEILGNVSGKSGGQEMESSWGWREVGGQACRWRHGQLELEGAWLAALRKVGLQEGLASPLDEWDLGKT